MKTLHRNVFVVMFVVCSIASLAAFAPRQGAAGNSQKQKQRKQQKTKAARPSTDPTIQVVSPNKGPIGAVVTISGSNFGKVAGQVSFNGADATEPTWNESKISVKVPPGAKTGDLTVTVGGVQSKPHKFTVVPPVIESLSPDLGAAGTTVTISGVNFDNEARVNFGGKIINPKDGNPGSSGSITVEVPAVKPGPISVFVKENGFESDVLKFEVLESASCIGYPITLGVLSGPDADLLAQTLSSTFQEKFVVTTFFKKDTTQSASGSGNDQASSPPNNALCVKDRKGGALPRLSDVKNLLTVERLLDQYNFKGGILNSNYVLKVTSRDFASRLEKAFPHPLLDLDIKSAEDYVILIPTSIVIAQIVPNSILSKDTAGLNHDFQLLSDIRARNAEGACQADSKEAEQIEPEQKTKKLEIKHQACITQNSIMLSALVPRDLLLQAEEVFPKNEQQLPPLEIRSFSGKHFILVLPQNSIDESSLLAAKAVQQYEFYQLDQKQAQMMAASASSSAGAASTPPGSPSTTTTTISTSSTKTSVPPPPKTGTPAPSKDDSPTTTVTTKTSTTVQPATQASSSGSAQGGGTSSGTSSGSNSSGGTSSSTASGSSTASASVAPAQGQQSGYLWSFDNVVRLYHYRDAAGIAAAINAAVPSGRPIVQALSNFGANDMLEILPSAVAQGYTIGDIERAVALLDLPRPQLSLQVWSYQISSKVRNPEKPYRNDLGRNNKRDTVQRKKCDDSSRAFEGSLEDDARTAVRNLDCAVEQANRNMIRALQNGMEAVFSQAATGSNKPAQQNATFPSDLFDEEFYYYLATKYSDCVKEDKYCLGYYDALDFPDGGAKNGVLQASLSRIFLFIAAAKDSKADSLVTEIVKAMDSGLNEQEVPQNQETGGAGQGAGTPNQGSAKYESPTFYRFEKQLHRIAQKDNLHLLRAAFLDFLFNFKWTINYPNDFVPYDLRHSAHVLDDLLQPLVNAFDGDIDEYVEKSLGSDKLIPKTHRAGLISQGMVQVAALSGTSAVVSGQVSNYFNITSPPAFSQLVQSILGGSGSNGGGGSDGGNGGSGGSGGSGSGGSSGSGSGSSSGSGNSGGGSKGSSNQSSGGSGSSAAMATALQTLISGNPYATAGIALANFISGPRITAQLTRGITLTVVPTSLDTASSAELNVNLLVNEPDGGPQSVNTSATQQDLLDRVATHSVSDTVRVQSLKLFDLSTLSMKITHPLPPTCFPVTDDQPGRAFSYIAAAPLSIPCGVWKSIFGATPLAGRLFQWPRSPITVDNRSVAIIRAVVVPNAMDIGEALNYASDRVLDPITDTTVALFSIQQLGWRVREFHRQMLQHIVNPRVDAPKLSRTHEDIRNPRTN